MRWKCPVCIFYGGTGFTLKPLVLKALLLIGTGFTLKPLVLKALLLIGTGFTLIGTKSVIIIF